MIIEKPPERSEHSDGEKGGEAYVYRLRLYRQGRHRYATIDEAIEAEIEEYEEIIASINASEKQENDEQ